MSKVWYGSLQNRLEENRQWCNEIKVGTGMTEYMWSDRHPYEVVAVKDQKHVSVREMGHKPSDKNTGFMNEWELFSDESKPIFEMAKRGNYWYFVTTITSEILEEYEKADTNEKVRIGLFLAHNDVDVEKLREKGTIRKYHRANVSFGKAEYYYDYEF